MSGTYQDDPSLDNTGDPLEQSLNQDGLGAPPEPPEPAVYKAMPDSRVPVSSKRGGVWRSRRDTAQKSMKDLVDAWDEAIRYYNHDQADHRDGNSSAFSGVPITAGNRHVAKRLNEMFSSTENVVFANVTAQVPELYAKNPIVSVSATPQNDPQVKDASDQFARAVQKLIDVLFAMKTPPGVNIKPKAKRNVLICLLTNCAWFEVGYTQKGQSSDQAMQDLVALSEQLATAEDDEDIREVEGKLTALEETIEILQPSGPFVRIRMPHQVLRDPNGSDPYLSDSNWVMIEDMLPTQYINAKFGIEDEETEEVKSVFEPTHVLNAGSSDTTDSDNFSIFSNSPNNDYNAYGFASREGYDKACYTKVWYVWDKVTRRLEMYADNDWKWPIWVWDDPYQLQGFFPLTPMWFHDSPGSVYAKGEVSYYLDQQDQINEINDEKRRALYWARRNIFYDRNSGITQEAIDRILEGPKPTATPLDVPDGKDPQKLIFSIPPPSMQFMQLFDKRDLYQAVDRIASTNEVERGGEFKTNTTNKAIDYYSTLGNMRTDMRLDAIEDALGDIGWKLAQLCLRFMDVATVNQLTGLDVSAFWRPLDNLRDLSQMAVSVIGGSTQKLTTQQKKQEAVQISQVLAQYVRAAPASALKATLQMMAKAFDDFMISTEDWQAIEQETQMMAQSQMGGAPGQPGTGTSTPGATAGAPQAGGGSAIAAVVQALSALPPPVLQAIGQALAQGVPPAQIFQQLLASQAQGQGAGGSAA